MKKRQTKQLKKQSLRTNCRWLLWIVGFIFFQGVCGKDTPLTKEEQEQFTGSYVVILRSGLSITHLFTDTSTQMIKVGQTSVEFKPVKYQDLEILKGFSNSTLNAKYYLKYEGDRKLVVMSDGSLHGFIKDDLLARILYKISNDVIPADETSKLLDAFNQIGTQTIIDNFKGKKFDEIANNIDSLFKKLPETLSQNRYRRIPIDAQLYPQITEQTSERNPNDVDNQFNSKVAIITCLILFIIIVICVCVQCCQNLADPNAAEHLEVETNDISYHYPASTDLVIDVKEIETKRSIRENMKSSASISTVSANDTKTNSTNLFTTETIDSEDPSSMQSMKTNSTLSVVFFSFVPTADIKETSTDFDPLESDDSEVKEPKAAQSKITKTTDEKLLIS